VGREAAVAAALALAAAAAACSAPPFGEVLVVADTDVAVPAFAGRLRVDLYTASPSNDWYESRDIATPDPATWPLSFSVYTDAPGEKRVRVRLRAYPEGAVRDYLGERFAPPSAFVEPPSAHSLDELCANAPLLPRAQLLTQRRAAAPVTELVPQADCAPPTRAGSVAARIDVTVGATYRFDVVDGSPTGGTPHFADTTLLLRADCKNAATQLACNDDRAPGDVRSRLVTWLDPGTYWLVSGGKYSNANDITLRWDDASALWPPAPPPMPALPAPGVFVPWIGDGPPPATEPAPGLAIDRIVDVRVRYGTRATARILLGGECLGTQADLLGGGGASCVDTAGVRAPVADARLDDGIDRGGASVQGRWNGAQAQPCTAAPRAAGTAPDGTPLHDEEICVPGGAFKLGDARLVGLPGFSAVPEQVAVVPAQRVDKYELTVARYRDAVRRGFVSPDASPFINDGALNWLDVDIYSTRSCTLSSAAAPDREALPLNCVSWQAARALCQFLGSDLATHVGWEWAALGAGRSGTKVLYPWGDDAPTCSRAQYGRGALSIDCALTGLQPVAAEPWASGDVTALGIVGMAGSLGEWALDSALEYSSPCWWQHPLRGVGCQETESVQRSARGGAWGVERWELRAAIPLRFPPGEPQFLQGVRCARPGAPP
jgi:formylglycine-generating enzyme required for sulfatase activity